MGEQLFIRLRGRIQGPYTSDQLQSLAKRGQFSRTHEVSTDGMNWARATNRPDLFPTLLADLAPPLLMSEETSFPPEPPPRATAAPPPADVWYYHQLGANHGPVDFTHLQYLANSGQIVAEDMVWKEGLPEWIAAGRVPGLMKAMGGVTPIQPSGFYVGAMAAPHHATSEFPRVSALAVASLVLGILWIAGIGSLLAIIFGSVSIYQIRVSHGKLAGTGLAVAGLVLGIVMLTLQVILIVTDELTRNQFGL